MSNSWQAINSLDPGKFEWNFKYVIFKPIFVIDGWGSSCEIALIWMSLDTTNDQSTLVQVMAWCRQATSHYLSQCWSRSLSPYDVTRPQWVNWTNADQVTRCHMVLTHWGRVTHICVGNLTIIGSDNGLSPCPPSHYLNQCWNIINWTLRNKLQWNFNPNANIFIQENPLENVVRKKAAILSRPQCVNMPQWVSILI